MASGIPAGVAFVELRLDPRDYITPAMQESSRRAARAAEDNIREGITAGVKSAARGVDQQMTKIGLAAGVAFGAALVEAIEVDKAQGKLTAQLGLTAKESKRIGGVAGKVYADAYGESMEDVSTAIKSVIQNMDGMRTASSKDLEETSKRAMDLSTILDEEVGATTRAVSQMLRTGLAKNGKEAFDILTRGAQLGVNKSEDLLDTFNEYGTQFRKIGLDGKTAMGILSQGLQGGARDADIVADALKEFSIRAVDMSKTSMQAYKDLGLNGKVMSQQIAKGGAGATAGLQTILDKLRQIRDPVAREAAAVGLFGTQAEDLGQALFKLDPRTAAARMGDFAGATDRAGKAMGETAAAQFTTFKRQLQKEVVDVIVNDVLPVLKNLQSGLAGMGVSPGDLAKVGMAIAGIAFAWKTVSLAIAAATFQVGRFSAASLVASGAQGAMRFAAAFRNVNLAYAANATLATRVGAALRSQLMLWRATAAAQGVSTARVIAYAAWQKIVMVATKAWAAVQWLLNAAMSANPIGIVIVALVALGALFVVLWKKSETFRTIVTGAWNAIKTGATTLWQWIQIAWNGIWGAIKTAWGYIQPIFNVIKNVLYNVLRVYFIILMNEVKVVWIAIRVAIKVAWVIIKAIFTAIKWYITNVLIPYYKLLWNVIKTVWNAIAAVIKWAWNNVIRPIWNALKAAINATLIVPFRALLSAVRTAWNALWGVIKSGYNSHIKPTFNALKSALGTVRDAFSSAVKWIKTQWDKLQGIAKTPVNFVIGVYNKGIVGLANKLADFAGVKNKLKEIPKLAKGGSLANPRDAVPMMTNGPMAIVGEGRKQHPEFVIPTDPRYRKRAAMLWQMAGSKIMGEKPKAGAMRGRNALGGEGIGFARGGSLQGLFSGGIIGDFVKGVKNFTIGNVEKGARILLGKVLGGTVPGSGQFRDMVAAIPGWIKKTILTWIKNKVATFGGGPAMERALRWAKTQSGKPYQWGGNGNPSWDCSGFMSAIESVIRGEKPHRRWATSSFNGGTPSGWHRNAKSGFMIGVLDNGNAHASHTAGTLLGTNVESSGSAGVRVGGGARGFNDGMFPWKYGFKADLGGGLAPGWNPPIYNGTGRIEPILDPRQAAIAERALDQSVVRGGDGATYDNRTYVYPQRADFTIQDLEALERKRDAMTRVGRPK